MRFLTFLVLGHVCLTDVASAQNPPIPAAYQDIYNLDTQNIASFEATILAGWNGQAYPVAYSAQLKSAAAENGSVLLTPSYYGGVLNELATLQSLGVHSVTVHIDYPILDPGYSAEWSQYLAFYQQLVHDIHSRNLLMVVENHIIFPQPGISSINCQAYYNSLSWTQYENNRATMAALIASQIAPDYLSVITEPDSEASSSGKSEVGTVSGSTEMLNIMLTDIAATGVRGVQIGAGVGTWLNGFQSFIQSYVATPLNFIDAHSYPVNRSYLPNLITIAQMATGAGKNMGISEAWVSKERDSELGVASDTTIFRRNPWSFWAPIDQSFLQALSQFAQWQHLAFISPFWTTYFHALLDYNTVSSLTAVQTLQQATAQSQAALQAAQITPTALAYKAITLPSGDTVAPSVPVGLSATVAQNTQVNLQWLPATDNVGVLGYNVYRDGQKLTSAVTLYYQDIGLAKSTNYAYTVNAFDASGNTSGLSAPLSVSTGPDIVPPSVPQNLTAQALSITQISLAWSPSTDNVGVKGYQIYRGTTPNNLTNIGGTMTGTTFVDPFGTPSMTYYYAVDAFDGAGNTSALSAQAVGTTLPDTTPPSVPGNVTATATSPTSVKVAWAATTDNFKVASYQIYSGTSPTALSPAGGSTSLSFTYTRARAHTTYYFAVSARDVAGNTSAQSPPVSVTTP